VGRGPTIRFGIVEGRAGPWTPAKLAYTVEEAAEMLSISRAQAYRLIDRGDLGSFKIGKCRRVSAEQLIDFVGGCTPRSM